MPDVFKVETLQSESINTATQPSLFSHLSAFSRIRWRDLWDVLLVRFLGGLGILVYRSNFNEWVEQSFHATPSVTGYLTSYTSFIGTLSGFTVGFVTARIPSSSMLLVITNFVQFLSVFGMAAHVRDVNGLALCMLPLSVANALGRVASASYLLERTSKSDSGLVIGVGASVLSLARAIAPFLGGLFGEISVAAPACAGAMFLLFSLIISSFTLLSSQRNHLD